MISLAMGVNLATTHLPVCVQAELERRIVEALTWDQRILDVTDFTFDSPKRGVLHTTFTAHTIFGDVQAEKTVNI